MWVPPTPRGWGRNQSSTPTIQPSSPLKRVVAMSQQAKPQPVPAEAETVSFSVRELLLYFLRLGTFGFGGPIALAGYMQRDLVEQRRWVSRSDYLEGLAF